MFRVLVVDDDQKLNSSLCVFLNKNGYEAVGSRDGADALVKLFEGRFDIIVSDIMMPEVDGFAFAEDVRREDPNIPILFVTARDDFSAKQKGFSIGIDDYMTKPLNLDELLLRMQALLRRAKINASQEIVIGNFRMDAGERVVYIDGEEIPFSAREFDILFKLLSFPKKAFSRMQLMNEFWDAGSEAGTRSVDVYMTRIRNKTSECDGFEIRTVHGLGYKAVIGK